MKRILLLISLCLFSLSYAQEFEVTPDGIFEKETGKDFVVIPIENKTANDLYNAMIKWINKQYKNPQEVLKGDIKDDFVKWNTYVPIIGYGKNIANIPFSALITEQVSFKDGKIKYEIINSDIYTKDNSNNKLVFKGGLFDGWSIYNKKGKLKQEELKQGIEDYFNSRVSELKQALSEEDKKDDW